MSYILDDPDEWEMVSESKIDGYMFGHAIGSASFGQRRRSPEEVAKIKAEKQRQHEDAVLAEADAIRARDSELGCHGPVTVSVKGGITE